MVLLEARRIEPPEEILSCLLLAASENHTTIVDSLEKFLTDRINFGEETEALLALEIASHLGWPLHKLVSGVHMEVFDTWERLANRILNNCLNRIAILSSKHFSVCCESIWRGKAHMGDLVKWYGFKGLFRRTRSILFPEEFFVSLTYELVYVELASALLHRSKERPRKFVSWTDALRDVGHISLTYPPPWIKEQLDDEQGLSNLCYFLSEIASSSSERPVQPEGIDAEALFGLFIILAISLEYQLDRNAVNSIKGRSHPFFDSFRWLLIARFDSEAVDKLQEAMDMYSFTEEQQNFIWRWSRGEFDLVQSEVLQGRRTLAEEDGKDGVFKA